jgi:hypothetical protein
MSMPPTILRRVRAALSLAAIWGAATGAIGLAVGLSLGIRHNPYPVLPDIRQWWFERHGLVVSLTVSWAAAGALFGLTFASLVGRVERGRSAMTVSPTRITVWGAVAGAGACMTWWIAMLQLRNPELRPLGFPLRPLLTAVALGAGYAWVTLKLARRADAGAIKDRLAEARRTPPLIPQSAEEAQSWERPEARDEQPVRERNANR